MAFDAINDWQPESQTGEHLKTRLMEATPMTMPDVLEAFLAEHDRSWRCDGGWEAIRGAI